MQRGTDNRAGLWITGGLWTFRSTGRVPVPVPVLSACREGLVRAYDFASQREQ